MNNWTSVHSIIAADEGWALLTLANGAVEIESIDEDLFPLDLDAENHVRRLAEAGSRLHQYALAVVSAPVPKEPRPDLKLPPTDQLARRFAVTLFCSATAEDWVKMLEDNAEETSAIVCHSHDFCDANMVMDRAWRELVGYSCSDVNEEAGYTDAQCELAMQRWNSAWNLAKERYLTANTGEERKRLLALRQSVARLAEVCGLAVPKVETNFGWNGLVGVILDQYQSLDASYRLRVQEDYIFSDEQATFAVCDGYHTFAMGIEADPNAFDGDERVEYLRGLYNKGYELGRKHLDDRD